MKDAPDGLVNMAEPKPPVYWYHCRKHPERGLLWYNDAHYESDHDGVAANLLRESCKGKDCKVCEANIRTARERDDATTATDVLQKKAPTPAVRQ